MDSVLSNEDRLNCSIFCINCSVLAFAPSRCTARDSHSVSQPGLAFEIAVPRGTYLNIVLCVEAASIKARYR